ncbi:MULTISPECIES: ABC transporter permease [unclassified Bradyrhizobium]|uniref:ABC transporter permease n=1 Tax=unclassified Bradyrhizobium TaxID=2631580 RepID=UPI00247A0A75|nr:MULTISPECIES: ABC transporter permease [unclassified Bradyrhizobium]WGR67788.1 ABC transporter permease [Bradyrhizobium sp. ISRA426]WGR79840.1 ABC transporter permease [Bradyrhizobium sp. ISRA430]WGR83027.1 ABC transporter permease [Bradyrhizobium sp. ISRA432]
MSLVPTLASRNLFHDRLRFLATLVGIVFSVVLVMIQMGLFLGFGRMVTTMIDHASADLWVLPKGAKCFEDPSLLDAKLRDKVASVDGVASVVPLVIGFSDWRLESGEITPIFVVGADLRDGILGPWNVVEGDVRALSQNGAVVVDRSYHDRLGVSEVGSTAEIRGRRVKIVALTDGIRSFTTTPYIFVDLKNARTYTGTFPDRASNLVVRLKPDANRDTVLKAVRARVGEHEVLTTDEFRSRSRSFWLFGTGAGAALFAGALLGVIVGTVIVAQTLYSSTKDHLSEFATLRAMGSSNGYIYGVIIYQALLNAVIGFVLATAIGAVVVEMTAKSALPIVITPWLIAALFVLTVVMCVASAIGAIVRVVRIDPATVFMR